MCDLALKMMWKEPLFLSYLSVFLVFQQIAP